MPSITILPPALSRIRNKAKVRDDLPAPVRPTMPICQIQYTVSVHKLHLTSNVQSNMHWTNIRRNVT